MPLIPLPGCELASRVRHGSSSWIAPKIPVSRTTHGETVIDHWFYLRDREHPATLPYLHAENAYTQAAMQATHGLRQRLYDEMIGRIQEDDSPTGLWQLQRLASIISRTERGRQYPIHRQ